MAKKVIVLGCGLVGATMARDLAADAELDVTVADVNGANLERAAGPRLKTKQVDLGNVKTLREAIAPFDLVAGAMPSALGFQTLRTVIEAGKPFADISFMAEDALELDSLAKKAGVTAVVDCGVAPGLANMAIGDAAAQLDEIDDAVYYVGGLPKHPKPPFYYKAPFAPSDVVEEYTRPARMIENGREVTKEALSEPAMMEFPPVGELEAFNTDGLRSLLRTVKAKNMREKTLRWPGHIALMRVFREMGLFRKDEMEVGSSQAGSLCHKVRPLDVTSRLMFPLWKLEEGEEEFTVLRVVVEGKRGRERRRYAYDLYDEYDAATGATSMARTTAFPCAIVARMLARGEIKMPGVQPPENLGRQLAATSPGGPGMMDHMIRELGTRGVNLQRRVDRL